jgi:putative spermidine/putrescine transport system substrate-binding protein
MNRRKYLGMLGGAALTSMIGAPLLATAQDKRKLRFCSNASAVSKIWDTAYAQGFTKNTGVEVAFTDVPNTAAAVMGTKGQGTYDLAYSTYTDVIMLSKNDALETFTEADFPRLKNIPARYQLRDAKGRVIGIGAYMAWYGISYNNKLASAADFQSWHDLANPKWKNKLALNRPMWTATYDLPILAHATGGSDTNVDAAVKLFSAIAQNALTSYTSNSHMAQLLNRGEITAGPYYSHRTFNLRREGNKDLAFAIPKEGALALPYAIAIPKGTKNREAVKDFLNYMMTPEPMRAMSALDPVISMDPTIKFTAEQVKEVGMDYDTLVSKIYMPDWAVLEQHWKARTAICEQIFARKT